MKGAKILTGEIEQTLGALAQTPQRLALLRQDVDETRLMRKSTPEEWSANEILAHLRACADVWGRRIQAMLAQDHPTLRYLSPRSWMKKDPYAGQSFDAALQKFSADRQELLRTLSNLDAAGWQRGATFTGTTRGREQTVLHYAQRIVQHEKEHCAQIEALLRG